jgi:hypothetical protein
MTDRDIAAAAIAELNRTPVKGFFWSTEAEKKIAVQLKTAFDVSDRDLQLPTFIDVVLRAQARQSSPCNAAEFAKYESHEICITVLAYSTAMLVAGLPRFARKLSYPHEYSPYSC